ncbi:zinc finger matrin-type protein 1 [Astyanax mexicanus]|uniref:zinc finger matrin-type protein 1 n=1 Tax=Astyanax mexicanus TaxID=7994 RepID=UPI0020CB6327|nr:zinc finger matrin-type protein 1 [Astyanax mexicanus]
MSVLEGGVSCGVTLDVENNGTVNPDSVQTVQNTNAPSCDVEDTGNDNELLKGLLTDTFCQVCEAVLLFESQRVSHYEGKKHAQKVRLYLQTKKAERIMQSQANSSFQSINVNPEKFCELCNMVFSSPVVAKSHYEGKVHSKNMRKNDTTPTTDLKTTAGPVTVPVAPQEGAIESKADQELKDSPDSPPQEVNLNDPDKYCKLCTASFNNPVMAQQHYSGRKHQRNQARQEMLGKLSSESETANTLTCPVCCVTLSSVETYEAHMQGNKHFVKEKKTVGLCKSQKKVYDSFQDELADYIQVQKSRGLEPKAKAEEELNDSESLGEEPEMPPPSSRLPPPPPHLSALPSFRPPQWRPPFQPQTGLFGYRGRFPTHLMQHQWGQGYPPHPPPLIPGLTGRSFRRGRSPSSFSSSSSYSDSSSSYSSSTSRSRSSSSDSGSDSSSDRRRQRTRKRKERMMKRRREQDDDSNKDERRRSSKRRRRGREDKEEEEEGHTNKAKREKKVGFEKDEDKERRKRKEKRHRGGDSSEEDEHGTKRRLGKKNRREKEVRYGKRRREEDKEVAREEGEEQREGVQIKGVQSTAGEPTEERTELRREEKSKRKKEKKKAKGKTDEGDKRTEEEKLWDETILGIF